MALNKYISVKISANPDSNSGFYPIVSFNSPSFAIEDEFYVGFDICSFFYTIKTTKTQTIYKLVKNNVRSYGASRHGSLVIAFSVPKGYVLDYGYTPYDVLSKLKDEFLKRCMTCKDSVRETYEFNQGVIDIHMLDDVAREFSITQKQCPNRIMNPDAPKGYIVKSDVEIEKLFHDTNYPEFDKYSEVIIAESVTQTNYIPINNIQIPRRINYDIYVDGVYKMSCDDLNELLTVSSNKPTNYYENNSVSFTIQELKNGNNLDGFEFNELEERIDISTQNWAKPKSERYWLKIENPKGFDKFKTNRNFINVTSKFGSITLDSELSFTLIGKQIAEKTALRYSLAKSLCENYKISSCKLDGNFVYIVIDAIRKTANANNLPTIVSRNGSPVIDVQIVIKDMLKLTGNVNRMKLKISTHEETLCSQTVSFCDKNSNGIYEGHFYVPKKYQGYVEFSTKNAVWKSKIITPVDDVCRLESKDFSITKKNFYEKNSGIIKIVVFALLTLLFLGLGFFAHDPIMSLFPASDTKRVIQNIGTGGASSGLLAPEAADSILNKAKVRLQAKDLNFHEIADLYQKFNNDSVILKKQDLLKFNNKICNQIKDYYAISEDIQSGDYERIKNDISHINDFHILGIHKDIIRLMDQKENIYRDNYSKLDNFLSIKKAFETELQNENTYKCPECSEIFDTKNKLNRHIPKHFKCGKCMLKFNSQDELNKHKNKCKKKSASNDKVKHELSER